MNLIHTEASGRFIEFSIARDKLRVRKKTETEKEHEESRTIWSMSAFCGKD